MPSVTRVAILPPVPVPYREPLFARLERRGRVAPAVVYLAGSQPGWDQSAEWFPAEHPYDARVLGSRQHARPGRSPVLVPRALGRMLDELDPDCVVSWEFGAATLRSLAWCRRRGRPLLIFSEVTPEAAAELSPLQRRVHRLLAPRVAGAIAASSRARARLIALGMEPERVEVSLQSADVESFEAVRRATPDPEGPVRVLAVGRLVADKNFAGLLDALAGAGLSDGEVELELCGTGPLEDELRDQARRLGAPVRFHGYVGPDALPGLYAQADVVALVSTYEPFGVTIREAVACGLPVICSRLAGAAGDLAVDGRNAVLVDPRDGGELAGALRRLVRDPDLRERMGAESRAIADATHPERDAEAFERAVLRAVEHHGRASSSSRR